MLCLGVVLLMFQFFILHFLIVLRQHFMVFVLLRKKLFYKKQIHQIQLWDTAIKFFRLLNLSIAVSQQSLEHYQASHAAQWQRTHLPMQKMQETRVPSLGWEDLLEEEMETHFKYFSLENSMDRGAWWAGYSPWG